ncbi:hypothetical protein Syun_006468 [Stephania yunnanensis]|uniref:Uncharacterized protein n=1 Tax=Stephania yunnanensis TaxID=152371 RepID=A0AAP0KYB0_9MAGN
MLTSLSRHSLTSPHPLPHVTPSPHLTFSLTYTLPHLSFSHRTLTRPGGGETEEEEERKKKKKRAGARETGVEELRRPKSGVGHVSRDVSETLECVLRYVRFHLKVTEGLHFHRSFSILCYCILFRDTLGWWSSYSHLFVVYLWHTML